MDLVKYHKWLRLMAEDDGPEARKLLPDLCGTPDAQGFFCEPEAIFGLLTDYGVSVDSQAAREALSARLAREGRLPEIAALLAYYDEENPEDPQKVGRLAGAALRLPDRGWRRTLADVARAAHEHHSRHRGEPAAERCVNGGDDLIRRNQIEAAQDPARRDDRDYRWPWVRILMDAAPCAVVEQECQMSTDAVYARVLEVCGQELANIDDPDRAANVGETWRRLLRIHVRRTVRNKRAWSPSKALAEFCGGLAAIQKPEPVRKGGPMLRSAAV